MTADRAAALLAFLSQSNSLARHRVRDWHCKGDGLEAVALTDAVLLTEGVVGMVVRRMVESASTVVLAERTIPIILRLHPLPPRRSRRAPRRRPSRDFLPPPPAPRAGPLRNSSRSLSKRRTRPSLTQSSQPGNGTPQTEPRPAFQQLNLSRSPGV